MTNLTLAVPFHRSHPYVDLVQDWADDINTQSGGTLTITIYTPGELIGAFEIADALTSGLIDLAFTATTYHPSFFPGFTGFDVPLSASLGAESAQAAWQTITDGDYAPSGITFLATAFAGATHILGSDPINSLDDLQGLKLRASGLANILLDDLGASPIILPSGEISAALTTRVMDGSLVSGTLLNTIGTVPGMDVLQGAPDGDILSPLLLALMANEDSLDGLDRRELRLLFSTTGQDLSGEWGDRIAEIEAAAIADYGVAETSFSPAFMTALEAEIDQFIASRLDAEDLALRADFTGALAPSPTIPGVSDFDQDAWDDGPWVVLLPRNLGVVNFDELDGATAILHVGGALEQAFADAFITYRISYEPVPVNTLAEAIQQFQSGAGDLLVLPQSAVQADLLPSDLMLVGQDGAVFSFGAGGLTLTGTTDSEQLDGASGADTLDGGRGDDTLNGGGGDDDLKAGVGDDSAEGGQGNDFLRGGIGEDTLNGGSGNDIIRGQKNADTMNGGDGDDNIKGGGGNDLIFGGDGNDFLKGGTRVDTIHGGDGDDRLFGNSFDDILNGDAGNDFLNAGGEEDELNGGTGNDTLKGGAGADVFIFEANMGADRVLDFRDDTDTLRISTALTGGNSDAASVIATYGTGSTLDFGNGNVITLVGVTDLSVLENDMLFY
ncbi:MAG: hypothetical protein N4A53_14420 [Pelagimonas sp.]|jgi:hypothetical protein|nr:hypothetical protein [Pelagimonas sp.]